ncbi:hypothetical protein PISMIDRAFT_680574, partial [Pisolithus microcarpus 441]
MGRRWTDSRDNHKILHCTTNIAHTQLDGFHPKPKERSWTTLKKLDLIPSYSPSIDTRIFDPLRNLHTHHHGCAAPHGVPP